MASTGYYEDKRSVHIPVELGKRIERWIEHQRRRAELSSGIKVRISFASAVATLIDRALMDERDA